MDDAIILDAFSERLELLTCACAGSIPGLLGALGIGDADAIASGVSLSRRRERGIRSDAIRREIVGAYYLGCDVARDRARIAYLESRFHNDYDIANELRIDRTGVSKIRRSGLMTKATRSVFETKYGLRSVSPSQQEVQVQGYARAASKARRSVLSEKCPDALSPEEVEFLITVIPDKVWMSSVCEGLGQVRNLLRYGEEIIGKVRASAPYLPAPFRVTNAFEIASITLEWRRSFLLAHHFISGEASDI